MMNARIENAVEDKFVEEGLEAPLVHVPNDLSYLEKTDAEIRDLALRVYRREVFTSDLVRDRDQDHMVAIFAPLAFLTEEQISQIGSNNPSMIYADMNTAQTYSINGYPVFSSFSYLSKDDHLRFIKAYCEILNSLEPPPTIWQRIKRFFS